MNFFTRRIATPTPASVTVETAAGPVAVTVRRHASARNYTLRYAGPGRGAVLTMPVRGAWREAERFLDRHTGWLANQVRKAPAGLAIADGAAIPLRGVSHVIRHAPGKRGTVVAASSEPSIHVGGGPEHLRRRVLDLLKREAKRDIEPAVMRHAAAIGVRVKAIRLRDPKSRWGSCSSSGTLSFSFRLVMAPPFVLDYLAAHEVAHLKEMNHSPRFWRLCEMLCPETPAARAWLRAHGAGLHAIGAED